MFKKAISLFLAISLLIPPGVYARRTEMSHERFVHLTDGEKNQLIVLTMEMMAELEENYTYEVSVNGHSEELQKKYSSIMKKLYDFLISEAGAAEEKKGLEWNQYAANFRTAIDEPGKSSDKCFFAGWPSKVQPHEYVVEVKIDEKKSHTCPKGVQKGATYPACTEADKKHTEYNQWLLTEKKDVKGQVKAAYEKAKQACDDAKAVEKACKEVITPATTKKVTKVDPKKLVCVVPSQIKDHTSAEYLAYKEHQEKMAKASNCKGDEISCNPSIFGFKRAADNSVFCVSSVIGSPAENASHSCMMKALDIKKDKDADSKDDRLAALRKALEAEPKYAKSIYEYMEKLCLCDTADLGTLKDNVHDGYLAKIRPHRTCYGLMEMMGQTLECSSPTTTADMDLTFFKKLKEHTEASNKKIYDQKATDKESIETYYDAYLKDVRSLQGYNDFCKGTIKPKPEEVKTVAKVYTCTVDEKTCKAAPVAPIGTAPVAPVAPAAAGTAPSVATPAPAVNISCSVKILDGEKEAAPGPISVEGPAGTPVEYKFKINDKDATASCALPKFPKEEAPKVKPCILILEGEDKEIKAAVSLDPEEAKKFTMEKFVWSDKTETKEATKTFTRMPEEALTVSVTVTLKLIVGGNESTTSCEAKKGPKETDEKPTLEVTAEKETDTQQPVIAKVTGKLEGWKLVWEDEGDGSPAIEEKKELSVAGDADPEAPEAPAEDKKPEEAAKEAAPAAPAEKKPAKFTQTEEPVKEENKVDRPRGKADYKICVRLEKGDQKVGPECVPVAKLKDAAPPPPPATPPPAKKGGGVAPQGGTPPPGFRGIKNWGNFGTY